MSNIDIVISIPYEDFELFKFNYAMNNPLSPISQEEIVRIIANGRTSPTPREKNYPLDDLEDYHFSREGFVDVFRKIFTSEEIVKLESDCQGCRCLDDFLLYYKDDIFYIIHFDSGTVISWYKHLGRANTCNNPWFNIYNLEKMLKMLKEEIKESD